jgi:hypothetical protein
MRTLVLLVALCAFCGVLPPFDNLGILYGQTVQGCPNSEERHWDAAHIAYYFSIHFWLTSASKPEKIAAQQVLDVVQKEMEAGRMTVSEAVEYIVLSPAWLAYLQNVPPSYQAYHLHRVLFGYVRKLDDPLITQWATIAQTNGARAMVAVGLANEEYRRVYASHNYVPFAMTYHEECAFRIVLSSHELDEQYLAEKAQAEEAADEEPSATIPSPTRPASPPALPPRVPPASRPAPAAAPRPEVRLICNGQVMPPGWVTIGYQSCASGGTGQVVLNPAGLPRGYIQIICAQSLFPEGWKEVGTEFNASCHLPGSVSNGNPNARRIQKQ